MPRYFFDRTDNRMIFRDDVGTDFPDEEAARRHVATLLPDLAHSSLADGDMHTFGCSARDAAGNEVYRAEMTYRGSYLGPRDRDDGEAT